MPELRIFNPETATENDFIKRLEFENYKNEEVNPDDPPGTLEQSISNAKGWKLFESLDIEIWQLWLNDTVIAELFLNVDTKEEENPHLFRFSLYVLKPYRTKGYAKLLLPKLLDFANKHKRSLAQSHTTSRVVAGREFAEYLNAHERYNESYNQLVLEKLDNSLVQNWLSESKLAAQSFEMGFWGNVYPENEIDAIAELIDVMNTAPKGDLDMADTKTKPKKLREGEAYIQARGDERRTLYLRHKESGELAGYTQTFWEPETPEVIYQDDTGVLPKYRGNKLGKWLKAAMLEKIMAERPNVKFIRTGNAVSNEPMLAINHALGFELYESTDVWQIEVDKLKAYLQS